MCGRFLFYDHQNPIIKEWISIAQKNLPPSLYASLSIEEVFPSQCVLTGIYDSNTKKIGMKVLKWGIPLSNKIVINTRIESLHTSPFYQDIGRCIIPCSGYYEWDKQTRQKYEINVNESVIYLAGICKKIQDQWYFSILTEPAQSIQKEIHHREPILLKRDDALAYLQTNDIDTILKKSERSRILTKV